ncbi:SphA family protein [Sphingomonas sp. 22176]|uniref:SphA family protein n=1 Tax=Sphingomonas sp. 22176 TaxID=3453884 RepID=UPI003F852DD3
MRSRTKWIVLTLCISAAINGTASAQSSAGLPASQIPDLVTPPNGINLGATSFGDGFSTLKPGVTLLQYLRYNDSNSITDKNGNESSVFRNPRIKVATLINQVSIATPWAIDGNRIAFDLMLPITSIDGSFDAGGRQLVDNGTSVGDLTFGPSIQFKPILKHGHPVASFRVALNAIAPTGGFNRHRDLNQSSGYWSLNPFVAWTVLPAKGWDISGRLQYLYNFKTTRIANAPTIPGFTFRDGQAGQLLYTNYSVSRDVGRAVSVGVAGYAVQQLDTDRISGIRLPDTKRSAFYVGPGFQINRLPRFDLTVNLYLPVTSRNYANGPQLNFLVVIPVR